jgi:hypothetical protein
MLCKATGIFMIIFSEFFLLATWSPKTKTVFKTVKKKKGGGPNWAETGPAGRRSRARAQRREGDA